jgi:hypothetical protein
MEPEYSLPCSHDPVLSQMNQIHIPSPYFFKIHFNINFPQSIAFNNSKVQVVRKISEMPYSLILPLPLVYLFSAHSYKVYITWYKTIRHKYWQCHISIVIELFQLSYCPMHFDAVWKHTNPLLYSNKFTNVKLNSRQE